ncbi:MAG TPA: valine--tRNA ligase [Pyrinomonadaceae bacterium]|nr:valine--tRNA ligase [Pyrinomonadaceae bacterium]
MELEKSYNPKQAEETHYKTWEANNCFTPEINENPNARAFSIVIPPPNVTGSLHMGHALQHTLMDVLTRRKRMLGFKTLFLVGVDHAGISTQLMVTRQLKKDEHKTPQDIGREEFTKRVWAWKEKFGDTITNQIRREGLSVDWTREQFTMDESLSLAVRNVFVRLYEEGWIYRGTRIVNWCPKDKTVLSDLEVKDETKKDGKLYFLQYPIKDSDKKLTVATTRPETMLGDTAVAVNPDDERYNDLIGKTIALPLTNREIPIIADEYVEVGFGTGAVKITPAHDPNDYEVGERHNLEKLVVMNADATMNENTGADFEGLDRYAAREKVVERFEELGLLKKVDDYEVVLPVCERCKTVVEPFLSEQWFVRMDEMRDVALDLMRRENAPHFFPQVPHEKVYTTWLENLKDWTISRQLWWGHQIPAWYDERGNVFVARSFEEAKQKAETENLTQDADVLDTWFSSALWAFSTLGWTGDEIQNSKFKIQNPEQSEILNPKSGILNDLETFYPTDVLVTNRDIIFLWVSRMVMTGLKFIGEKPFKDVIIHGTVLDKNGQRMSKTKNNGIDPLDVFDKYGVDATRLALADSATGVDFAWRDEKVESFRNFANKIWNATRFCLLNSDGAQVDYSYLNPKAEVKEIVKTLNDELVELDEEDEEFLDKIKPEFARDNPKENLSVADKWIISRLNKTALTVNQSLDNYNFHEATQTLYHFFWDDFCDWYIELVKDEITSDVPNVGRDAARSRIITIIEQSLRLLHPFMPFLTEELWQKLPNVSSDLHNGAYKNAAQTIMLADFPAGDVSMVDEQSEAEMQAVIELISKVRNIRAEMNIKPGDKPAIHVAAGQDLQNIFKSNEAQILKLARAERLNLSETLDVPRASAKAVLTGGAEIALPLEGLIDFDKERSRVENQLEKLILENERLTKQLTNENFVSRAPQEKVQEIRERVAEIKQQNKTLKQNLEALK